MIINPWIIILIIYYTYQQCFIETIQYTLVWGGGGGGDWGYLTLKISVLFEIFSEFRVLAAGVTGPY